jgi:sugar O-acyltransferase (sialic acid O-acetyltransferase NeuD family)
MITETSIHRCEQLNVNDSSYKLAELFFVNGSTVKKGELVISLDSSKASYEVRAENDGIFFTSHKVGDVVQVNQGLFLVLERYCPTAESEYRAALAPITESKTSTPTDAVGKTITAKAQKLLDSHGIDPQVFKESLITEKVVNDLILSSSRRSARDAVVARAANTNCYRRIAVIGGGKAFVQLLDAMTGSLMRPVCIYDDEASKRGQTIYGVPVRGSVDASLIKADLDDQLFDAVVISVSGSISFRKATYEKLKAIEIPFATVIHRSAYVGIETTIGDGNVILANTSIGPCAEIGNNNFISAHCNIEHHNILGNHCTFGPGVMTSGSVTIEDEVKFGTGVFIEPRLVLGARSVISSGCIIVKNIPPKMIAFTRASEVVLKSSEA